MLRANSRCVIKGNDSIPLVKPIHPFIIAVNPEAKPAATKFLLVFPG